MAEFRTVGGLLTPFATIRNSLATIRGSPWKTDQKDAEDKLEKAQKEVIAFLRGLEPGTLIRVVPYANGEVQRLRFLNGELVHLSIDEAGGVSFTVSSEGRAALCKADYWIKEILQIEICEICKRKE